LAALAPAALGERFERLARRVALHHDLTDPVVGQAACYLLFHLHRVRTLKILRIGVLPMQAPTTTTAATLLPTNLGLRVALVPRPHFFVKRALAATGCVSRITYKKSSVEKRVLAYKGAPW
jgi:hypothetical protein